MPGTRRKDGGGSVTEREKGGWKSESKGDENIDKDRDGENTVREGGEEADLTSTRASLSE